MPKKRKKDKIAADQRRQIQAEKLTNYSFVKPPTEKAPLNPDTSQTKDKTHLEKATRTIQNKIHDPEHRHLKKDLIKIIIFTIFALCFHGVLYFILRG